MFDYDKTPATANSQEDFNSHFLIALKDNKEPIIIAFITSKEQANLELALKLRKQGKITTPSLLFKESDRQEVDSLIGRGVFNFKQFNRGIHSNTRIFKLRIVNKIKGKATNILYKKLILVI